MFIIEHDYMDYFISCRPNELSIVKNKKLLIMHNHKSMAYASVRLGDQVNRLMELGFETKNIYIVTQLDYDKDIILSYSPGINVLPYDRWLMQLFERQVTKFIFKFDKPNEPCELKMKRFSILIRRPTIERFQFICRLIANNLLDSFNYTFVNHTPAGDQDVTYEDFKQMIPQDLEQHKSIIESWIVGMPYSIRPSASLGPGLHEFDDYPLNINHYFNNSRINVVFETEPTSASFLTEKTYKAILAKKPLIIVSQQHALKALRKGGYQTFGHIINESYDDIENYDDRVQAILTEITRLNNLPEEDFNNLVNSCTPMIEHNYTNLFDVAYRRIPEEFCIKALTTF